MNAYCVWVFHVPPKIMLIDYKTSIAAYYKFNLSIAHQHINSLQNKMDEIRTLLNLLYNNSRCSFNLPRLKLVGLIHPNPGPTTERTTDINNLHHNDKPQLKINCLYTNARSIVYKIDELQVLATNVDVLAMTETWYHRISTAARSCLI